MEHAAHAGGGHGHGDDHAKGPGKGIGITMAIMGVLLALCAAMVGSERTELVKTMVEQSNVWGEYQTQATKYRAMLTQLQTLHALTPNADEVAKFEHALDKLKRPAQVAPPVEKGTKEALVHVDTGDIIEAVKLATAELSDILSPDLEDSAQFVDRIWEFRHERDEAHEWFESFDAEVNAHFQASEWYEKAQLASEIGIVIASVALLLGSRPFWWVAIVAGIACAGIIGVTWYRTHDAVHRTCDEEKNPNDPDDEGKLWARFPPEHGEKADPKACTPGAMQWIDHEKETYERMKKSTNTEADDEALINTVIGRIRKHNEGAPKDKQVALPVDEEAKLVKKMHEEHAPAAAASSGGHGGHH